MNKRYNWKAWRSNKYFFINSFIRVAWIKMWQENLCFCILWKLRLFYCKFNRSPWCIQICRKKIVMGSGLCQNIAYLDPLKKYTYWSFHCTAESILSGRPFQCREIGLGGAAVVLSLQGLHSQNVRFFNKYFGICIRFWVHILVSYIFKNWLTRTGFYCNWSTWGFLFVVPLGTPYVKKSTVPIKPNLSPE